MTTEQTTRLQFLQEKAASGASPLTAKEQNELDALLKESEAPKPATNDAPKVAKVATLMDANVPIPRKYENVYADVRRDNTRLWESKLPFTQIEGKYADYAQALAAALVEVSANPEKFAKSLVVANSVGTVSYGDKFANKYTANGVELFTPVPLSQTVSLASGIVGNFVACKVTAAVPVAPEKVGNREVAREEYEDRNKAKKVDVFISYSVWVEVSPSIATAIQNAEKLVELQNLMKMARGE